MISPLAYVDPAAKLGKNVTVQPFAYIEGDVEIGDDCVIMAGAHILNGTRMGRKNTVHHGAVLASVPQDFHYEGEDSRERGSGTRHTRRRRDTHRKRQLPDGRRTPLPRCADRQPLRAGHPQHGGRREHCGRLHHPEQQRHCAAILPHRQLGAHPVGLPHIERRAALCHHGGQPRAVPRHQRRRAAAQEPASCATS